MGRKIRAPFRSFLKNAVLAGGRKKGPKLREQPIFSYVYCASYCYYCLNYCHQTAIVLVAKTLSISVLVT